MTIAAVVGVLAVATGCDVSPSSSLGRATSSLGPHRAVFARFDDWARKTQATARLTPNREALDDATFAPLRNDSDVLAAWIELRTERNVTLAMPASTPAPDVERWVSIRDDDLGSLQVATAERCPVNVPRWWRQGRGRGPCVIASRGRATGLDRQLVVTVAFLTAKDGAPGALNR